MNVFAWYLLTMIVIGFVWVAVMLFGTIASIAAERKRKP